MTQIVENRNHFRSKNAFLRHQNGNLFEQKMFNYYFTQKRTHFSFQVVAVDKGAGWGEFVIIFLCY